MIRGQIKNIVRGREQKLRQQTFPALRSSDQTKRNGNEARVENFIQITVFCPPEPRVGAFGYRNAGKVYRCLL